MIGSNIKTRGSQRFPNFSFKRFHGFWAMGVNPAYISGLHTYCINAHLKTVQYIGILSNLKHREAAEFLTMISKVNYQNNGDYLVNLFYFFLQGPRLAQLDNFDNMENDYDQMTTTIMANTTPVVSSSAFTFCMMT
jgi:hypothetical protein